MSPIFLLLPIVFALLSNAEMTSASKTDDSSSTNLIVKGFRYKKRIICDAILKEETLPKENPSSTKNRNALIVLISAFSSISICSIALFFVSRRR